MQQDNTTKIRLGKDNEANLFGKPQKYDYSKYQNLKEIDWDDELASKFFPIVEKLNLSQDSLNLLLDIALEMSMKQKDFYEKDEETKYLNNIENYNKLLKEDNELPNANSLKMEEYIKIANAAYSDFASPKLKEILEKTGLVYHPELIKMFHKIGELSQEDNLSHYGKPAIEELTPAQILYGQNK